MLLNKNQRYVFEYIQWHVELNNYPLFVEKI